MPPPHKQRHGAITGGADRRKPPSPSGVWSWVWWRQATIFGFALWSLLACLQKYGPTSTNLPGLLQVFALSLIANALHALERAIRDLISAMGRRKTDR